MNRVLGFVLIFLTIFVSSATSIEVSSLQSEKRLEFNELFPKKICDDIYNNSSFGLEKKPNREIMLMNYINLKKLKVNETDAILTIYLDQRSYSYKEPKLDLIIFRSLSDDFSDQIQSITERITKAGTKKIVVCEYDLSTSLKDGKFFDFRMSFDNSLKVIMNENPQLQPKILIYYDGTIEYVFFDEEISYAVPEFDYRIYPFDNHQFRFSISSKIYENLYFEKSNKFKILLDETKKNNYLNVSSPGWTVNSYISYPAVDSLTDAYSEYSKHSLKSDLIIERNWLPYLLKFIIPIVVITLLSYACVYITLADGRAGLLGTLLVSFVAFNLVLVGRIPELPYVTLFDWIVLMGYLISALSIIALCVESFYLSYYFKGTAKRRFSKVTIVIKIAFPIVYILVLFFGFQQFVST